MGQVAAKIKQMAERLELNKDKRNARLSKSLLEISNKQTSTSDLRSAEQQTKESNMLLEVMSKLELIETVVENQRQILGDQEAKLRVLENTVRNAQAALDKVKEQAPRDEDIEASKETQETPLGRLFDSIFQEKSKNEEEIEDSHEVMRQHGEVLQNHEQRLEAAIDKIQMIWDKVTQDKESNPTLDAQQEEIKELKKLVDSLRQNHDALKVESHSELETQQKILETLFAGFVVAFLLLVFICMYCK